ncbi:Threonyl/alanyl tRNA synthetase [Elsinoe ampelina]|uniref:Threonyl/alanyl tRNA synthetase n=1 Tax=Elsinoe ampelina TaxID=302913 RepID=A0A6A6G9L4_9PEZI|nr:Threonyl/alanyl tRNA synthetase [Elsinoe ampelina]
MGDTSVSKTHLTFHFDADLHETDTTIQSVASVTSLSEANRGLFKSISEDDFVVVTKETIFHPQGGGQPSDVGTITSSSSKFTVTAARTDAEGLGHVLHLGQFSSDTHFQVGEQVSQKIDSAKRIYYSRLHTAGHVLGAAVRRLLQDKVPNFDELKASHFPDSAGCEFQGSIGGEHKAEIQKQLDEYLEKAMPVEIDWWSEEDFRREGLERLIPEAMRGKEWEEKLRVVRIVGAEVYPCGGTHVHTTDKCGKTTVKKISRSKGNSRVSYTVVE